MHCQPADTIRVDQRSTVMAAGSRKHLMSSQPATQCKKARLDDSKILQLASCCAVVDQHDSDHSSDDELPTSVAERHTLTAEEEFLAACLDDLKYVRCPEDESEEEEEEEAEAAGDDEQKAASFLQMLSAAFCSDLACEAAPHSIAQPACSAASEVSLDAWRPSEEGVPGLNGEEAQSTRQCEAECSSGQCEVQFPVQPDDVVFTLQPQVPAEAQSEAQCEPEPEAQSQPQREVQSDAQPEVSLGGWAAPHQPSHQASGSQRCRLALCSCSAAPKASCAQQAALEDDACSRALVN